MSVLIHIICIPCMPLVLRYCSPYGQVMWILNLWRSRYVFWSALLNSHFLLIFAQIDILVIMSYLELKLIIYQNCSSHLKLWANRHLFPGTSFSFCLSSLSFPEFILNQKIVLAAFLYLKPQFERLPFSLWLHTWHSGTKSNQHIWNVLFFCISRFICRIKAIAVIM